MERVNFVDYINKLSVELGRDMSLSDTGFWDNPEPNVWIHRADDTRVDIFKDWISINGYISFSDILLLGRMLNLNTNRTLEDLGWKHTSNKDYIKGCERIFIMDDEVGIKDSDIRIDDFAGLVKTIKNWLLLPYETKITYERELANMKSEVRFKCLYCGKDMFAIKHKSGDKYMHCVNCGFKHSWR